MSSNETFIEKLKYLYTLELKQMKCNVMGLDITVDKYNNLISEIDIYVTFDYDGYLESYDPYSFSDGIKNLLHKVRDCFTAYTPTREGKLVKGDDNVYCSDAFIISMEFKYEETHIFNVNFKLTYPD